MQQIAAVLYCKYSKHKGVLQWSDIIHKTVQPPVPYNMAWEAVLTNKHPELEHFYDFKQ